MTDRLTHSWQADRAHLVNLAYRILGDVGDAEDVVQEAFARLARISADEIDDERGWLTVVTSRLCLDQVRSARARREWVPGPAVIEAAAGSSPDPADRVTLDDEVRSALFVVLERLSPAERVAFVLHDVFRTPFEDIAVTLGKPVATCRQLARRARQKIGEAPARPLEVGPSEHQAVTARFIVACSDGDLDALLDVLAPNVWGVADLVGPGLDPIVTHGPAVVSENLLRYYGNGATLVSHPLVARTVLAFQQRVLFAVMTLTLEGDRVAKIEVRLDLAAAPSFPDAR